MLSQQPEADRRRLNIRRMADLESLHVVNGLRAVELGGQRQACHSDALCVAQLVHLQPNESRVGRDGTDTSAMKCTAASV